MSAARPLFPFRDEILKDFEVVLDGGRLMYGTFQARFERAFAEYCGVPHAVSMSSCTAALETCLRYFDVTGRRVAVPTNTFVSTATAVTYAGGQPVFYDVGWDNTVDERALARLLDRRKVAGLVVVHLAGFVHPQIEALVAMARARGIFLIEDCAHAAGARYQDRSAGAFGDAGCFSFYPTKVITTGSGGMITTSDRRLQQHADSVRLHGRGRDLYDVVRFGNDWFLDEFRCVVGYHQLRAIEDFIGGRAAAARLYLERLEGTGLTLPEARAGHRPSWYKFSVRRPGWTAAATDAFMAACQERGVETERLYWPLCPLQPVFRRSLGYSQRDFPESVSAWRSHFTLPIHAGITAEQVEYVVKCVGDLERAVPLNARSKSKSRRGPGGSEARRRTS